MDICVTTRTGTLRGLVVTEKIKLTISEGKPIPSTFLGGLTISDYIIAPAFERLIVVRYGMVGGSKIINRIKVFLDGVVGREALQPSRPSDPLLLE